MNTVKVIQLTQPPVIEINGKRGMIYSHTIGYKPNLTPINVYAVKVAPEYNQTGAFEIQGRTVRNLIAQIEKHPDVLVAK